jgi:hypothetical protein
MIRTGPKSHPKWVMPATRPGGTVPPTVQPGLPRTAAGPGKQQRRDLHMADEVSQYRSAGRAEKTTSGWAVGFILFAAIMMIMAGIFQFFAGLVAIFDNEFYVATRNYVFQFDATTWGWIHLLVGLLVALAGLGLLAGRTWARVVGITLAVLSAIANFLFIPYYPFWSLTAIALDVFVIWALAAHGRELQNTGY